MSESESERPIFYEERHFLKEAPFPIEHRQPIREQHSRPILDRDLVCASTCFFHRPSLASLRADDHDEMSALAISPAGLALASPLRVTGKPPAPYRLVAAFPIARPDQPQATPAILSSRRRAHSSPTSPPPSSPQAISPPPVASRSGSRHAPVAPLRSAPSSSPRRSPPAPSRPRRVTRPRRRSTTPA